MSIFLQHKIISALLISSLVLLLPGCSEQNVSADKIDESADNTEENINEKIKKESDRLIKDKPDEEDTEEESNTGSEDTVEMI